MSTYNKTVWQDGDIITADKMNNIENGIYSYNEDITNLETNKQDALTFDQTPTDESTNPVTSVGIKNAIEAAVEVTAPGIYESASGSIVSFADGADDLPMKSAVVNIEPIQEGSGDPSPENVRPISGRTGLSVTKCGKNLWSFAQVYNPTGYAILLDGVPFELFPGTYTFSAIPNITRDSIALFGYYEDGTRTEIARLNASTAKKSATKTITKKVVSLYFASNSAGTISDIQLELGSTATAYEPYKGTEFSVNWESEAGTVYGGTLDIVSGKLVVNRAIFTESGSSQILQSQANKFYIRKNDALRITAINQTTEASVISDRFRSTTWADLSKNNWGCSPLYGSGVAFASIDITTVQGWKDYFTQNHTQFSYKLESPIEIQLTPQETRTLLGVNNVWSDGGDMAVEYPADTKLYIDQKITEAIAAALA